MTSLPNPAKKTRAPIPFGAKLYRFFPLLLALLILSVPGESHGQLFKKLKEKREAKRENVRTANAPAMQSKLKPGEFEWHPERSPDGPLLLVVSIDDQTAYVYRNGVQIGRSTVSTGRAGKETPTGVFSILEKNRDHESNIYEGAQMPNMQRLTWTGIAIHAGSLPGYPASAGCIRLPYRFSDYLFKETNLGGTVVITGKQTEPSRSDKPAAILLASQMESTQTPGRKPFWNPGKSPEGPVAVLVSIADREVYVYRNGVLIGQSPIGINRSASRVDGGVFLMLEGHAGVPSPVVPGKVMRSWSTLSLEADADPNVNFPENLQGTVRIPKDFARRVYDILNPGTLMIVTNQSSTDQTRSSTGFTIMN